MKEGIEERLRVNVLTVQANWNGSLTLATSSSLSKLKEFGPKTGVESFPNEHLVNSLEEDEVDDDDPPR